MARFVLRKPSLQTHMRSHPVELDVCFVYFHTRCVRTAKALARLRGCTNNVLSFLSKEQIVINVHVQWKKLIIQSLRDMDFPECL